MRTRLRFSIRTLLAVVTALAVGLGGWIGYSKDKLNKLAAMRQEGAIVIVRNGTPKWLRSIGVEQLSPFYSVSTVELYVTPMGDEALVGNSDKLISKEEAKSCILEQAAEARSYGSKDIQLILIDDFNAEWMEFAAANSMAVIGDRRPRYLARLAANQESGANINP
jgi:hypothetical protein